MHYKHFKTLLLLLFCSFFSQSQPLEQSCPSMCTCKKLNQRTDSLLIKVRCGDETNKINNLNEIQFMNIATSIVQFNLSNNLLTSFQPKDLLSSVQKLDLSYNQLTVLENNQFAKLPNLRRLELSGNNIKNIGLFAFENLTKLERLKLNDNHINSIEIGTFDSLLSLIQLNISNNPLTCDCGLLWIVDWSQKKSLKLVSNPKCESPPLFQGILLRKIKIGDDIKCESPALSSGIPIEMDPADNQVVFEGDSLKLECKAPSIYSYDSASRSKIEWTWLDSDPNYYFDDISIDSYWAQSTSISSVLRIPKLIRNHTGIWNCQLLARQGNHSKGITIVVISNDTRYCPMVVTKSNKGTYTWPRTIVNYTATIPCESINLSYDSVMQKASYFCNEREQWEQLNTEMCSYISETTKIFEQFSKVNSSIGIMESAKHFRNYTSDFNHFKDGMDVVFAVRTMKNYLNYLNANQAGGVLMDVTNNLLDLPKEYLREAIYEYNIAGSLLEFIEVLAGISSTSFLHKTNIAAEIFPSKKGGFPGLKCIWYSDLKISTERLFHCVANHQADLNESHGKHTDASITIPETLFDQLSAQNHNLSESVYNLFVSVQNSNKLFPIDEMDKYAFDVTSSVVGAKLLNMVVTNLTDPVHIMLKIPEPAPQSVTPVWWNPRENKSGAWTSDGCHTIHQTLEHVTFACKNLGHFGLKQAISNASLHTYPAKFKLSHPAIYVGTFILFTSLLVAIVTYLLCYAAIQMPKKAKHSLINLWIGVCLLCFFYIFGIHQTEDVKLCQIIGILLHYFTLSSILWICVGVNCMYKRLSKADLMQLHDDELAPDQPIKKPILGLYFVGWGVAIIICGLSAAINVREYATPNYCFLKAGPPLSALYIPFFIMLAFLGIFFLLIRCAIYSSDSNGHLSEGTQATENVDLDLLEPNFALNETRSVLSESSTLSSSEMEDSEHMPSAQLKAYVIFLFIYILAWLACAFATTEPKYFFVFENDFFSIVYAIFATILAAFTLFFYCVARSDVRGQWIMFNRWLKRNKRCFRSRNVSDASPAPQLVPPPPPVSNSLIGEFQVLSRSSSRSSSRTKSNSRASNGGLKPSDLNGSFGDNSAKNNVNLVVLHRQQYRANAIPNIIENPTSAAEVFYNPQQSIVAKKFFRRQKRHLMKRNNLMAARPRDSDSDVHHVKDNARVDHQSRFGTSSKVNNKNINVNSEQLFRQREQNPNIFSDSAEEYEPANLGHSRRNNRHKTRKKLVGDEIRQADLRESTMRSVSQQCTLEYSSENVSDSILEKASPDLGSSTPFKSNLGRENAINVSEINSFVDVGEQALAPIYMNPSHTGDDYDKEVQNNRDSSMSVSDLDELYQQIRRRPVVNQFEVRRSSSCLSDSDVVAYNNLRLHRSQPDCSSFSDNVETTV